MKTSLILSVLLASAMAHSQAIPAARETVLPVSLRYTATGANAPPGTCGCFFMQGGSMDVAFPIRSQLSAVIDVTGATTSRIAGTSRGLSTLTLLAGPRYTLPLRRMSFAGQALIGAARGFDADFLVGPNRADTATVFSFAAGGMLEVPLTRHIGLRAAELEYVQSSLPNGADNQQRNIRIGAGIVFRIPLPDNRRSR